MLKTLGKNVFCIYGDDRLEIYSYDTKVLTVTENGEFQRNWKGWSITTQRHINKVLQEFGYPAINKETWLKLPTKFN